MPTSAASASHEVHFTPASPAQRIGGASEARRQSRSVRRASSGPAPTGSGGHAIAIRASTAERPCAMGLPVFVGSAFVAKYPSGGGNFWVPLQYLLGLRALGVEAHWLALLWAGGDRRRAREFVDAFRGAVERLGVRECVTLVCFPEGSRGDPPGRAEHHGLAPTELRAPARDALL